MAFGAWPHQEFIMACKGRMDKLAKPDHSGAHVVERGEVEGVAPPNWRQDADTLQAWFIQNCSAYGIRATYDDSARKFTLFRA